MQYLGKVYGIDGHILVDTVARHCYLSSSYNKNVGLHIKIIMVKWYWEMDWKLIWRGPINVHVKIQQYLSQVSCLII